MLGRERDGSASWQMPRDRQARPGTNATCVCPSGGGGVRGVTGATQTEADPLTISHFAMRMDDATGLLGRELLEVGALVRVRHWARESARDGCAIAQNTRCGAVTREGKGAAIWPSIFGLQTGLGQWPLAGGRRSRRSIGVANRVWTRSFDCQSR
jgi:hypothetical protein